jgi:hypothetical protein
MQPFRKLYIFVYAFSVDKILDVISAYEPKKNNENPRVEINSTLKNGSAMT